MILNAMALFITISLMTTRYIIYCIIMSWDCETVSLITQIIIETIVIHIYSLPVGQRLTLPCYLILNASIFEHRVSTLTSEDIDLLPTFTFRMLAIWNRMATGLTMGLVRHHSPIICVWPRWHQSVLSYYFLSLLCY